MSVYSILNGIDPHLTWPGILVLILMVAGGGVFYCLPSGFGRVWAGPMLRGAVAALGSLAALQLVLAAGYLFYPRYIDWIEPTIVAASWIGSHGGYFYPLPDGGDVAGVWYGPVLYQVTAFMLWLLGSSIESSKILGVAAFFAAQLISLRALRRARATASQAFTITAIQCLLQAGFANQGSAFGLRTDPLLLLAAEVSVLVAISAPNFVNAAVLGAMMGLAANLKLQGIFFIFPIFCFFISSASGNLPRAQLFATAAFAGLAALALPFAWHGASLARYVNLLALARHQGMWRWVVEKNIVYLAMCWSPFVWLYFAFRPKLPAGLLWFGAAFVPAMAMVTIAASLPGGGPYNFLAFLPSLAWALVRFLQIIRHHDPGNAPRLRLSCLGMTLAFLIGFTPDIAIAWYPLTRQYADSARVRQARAEIEEEMRRHPDEHLEVGPGPYEDLRVIPVFRGNPLAIDSESWNELRGAGIGEGNTRNLIRTCRIDIWLLPSTGPLFSEHLAPGLYSPEFLADFLAHYRKEPSGGLLDAWRCIRKD